MIEIVKSGNSNEVYLKDKNIRCRTPKIIKAASSFGLPTSDFNIID